MPDASDGGCADLHPLREVFGDARIILLGEQSHGDGTTFLIKTRLIKFLHEEMGFDVLAFESGLYDSRVAWQLLRDGSDPTEAFRHGIYTTWSESMQLEPLIDYVGERVSSDRPLELIGFDIQPNHLGAELIGDAELSLGTLGFDLSQSEDWGSNDAL